MADGLMGSPSQRRPQSAGTPRSRSCPPITLGVQVAIGRQVQLATSGQIRMSADTEDERRAEARHSHRRLHQPEVVAERIAEGSIDAVRRRSPWRATGVEQRALVPSAASITSMRIRQPRIQPVTEADWTDDSRPVLAANAARGPVLNVFTTIARHPKLLKRWTVFANHVLNGSTLPPRERELVILRTGYLCKSGYEWAQHVAIGRLAGLTDGEVERLTLGSTADGWSDGDRLLLQATEELVADRIPLLRKRVQFCTSSALMPTKLLPMR